MPKMTLLIDGDIIAFSSVSAHFHEIEWEPDLWTYHVEMDKAKDAMHAQVDRLRKDTGADEVIVCLTGADNFRMKILPTYKGHRKRKPPGYRAFQAWCQKEFNAYLRPGLEGDDIIGILATHPTIVPGPRLIWSADKDLGQIPGDHWKDGRVETVSPDQAQALHVIQTLTGDPTDNYKGCPGWGKMKAQGLLRKLDGAGWPSVWAQVIEAYSSQGLEYDEFLAQARVARILTHDLYDMKLKEPILWTPPV